MKTLLRAAVVLELQARVRRLEPTDHALWGVMSAGEMVRHVEQSFEIVLGELRPEAVRPDSPGRRKLMKMAALRIPVQWPKGVATVPELDQRALRVDPGVFEVVRSKLEENLDRLARAEAIEREHPMFGPMSRWDWMRWGYLHTDHHLRQFGR